MKSIRKKKKATPAYIENWNAMPIPAGQERNVLNGVVVKHSMLVVHPSKINLDLFKKLLRIPIMYGQEHGFLPPDMDADRFFYIPVNTYGERMTKKSTENTMAYIQQICKEHDILAVLTVGKAAYKWTYGQGAATPLSTLVGNILFNGLTGDVPLIVMNEVDFLDCMLSITFRQHENEGDQIEFDPNSDRTQSSDDREQLTIDMAKVLADMMDSMHNLKEHLTK